MNKVLVKVFLPIMFEQYEVKIPIEKSVYNIIILLLKGINELNEFNYCVDSIPILYNKSTGMHYDLNAKIQDTDIKNGTTLILI